MIIETATVNTELLLWEFGHRAPNTSSTKYQAQSMEQKNH